jgi:uncharacterized repeat protein (TIGR01451 family)
VESSVNISVVKTVNVSGEVLNGALITYTITVTNYGPDNATGVCVVDILDSRLAYLSSNASRGSYNINNGIWTIGNLDNGETVVLDIFVHLNGVGDLVNVASVVVDQNNTGDNSTTSNGTNITVIPSANLLIVKTSNVSGSVKNGDLIRYTITVTNNGPDTATGVYVLDKLDNRLIYINSNPNTGVYSLRDSVWTIGNLDNGQTVVMEMFLRVNGTGNIANIANVTANQKSSSNTNTTADRSDIFALPLVNLKVTITTDVTVTTIGKNIVYTIIVTNLGPDKATGVVTNLDFDAGLIYVSHNAEKGKFIYLSGDSERSSKSNSYLSGIWEIGTLLNGESVVLKIVTKTSALGILRAYANVTSNESLGNQSEVYATVNVDVEPKPKPVPDNTTNKTNGNAGMKQTTVPVIVIILLFSILTLIGCRKREEDDKQ